MNQNRIAESVQKNYQKCLLRTQHRIPFKLTPLIVTFCEGYITTIHIRNFIEMGLTVVRFKISNITKDNKISMINMIKDAVDWYSQKHEVKTWPIAISIDIPNACIRTGRLKDNTIEKIDIIDDSIIKVTSDSKLCCQCVSEMIYIDDPYTLKTVPVGTEITVCLGMIVLVVIEIVDESTLKCKVLRGGAMGNQEFVCIRGVNYLKPPLSKADLDLIEFAKEYKLDIITIHSIRRSTTLKRIRKMFRDADKCPLLLSTICEQEGLDNFDEILKESDGIILARQFLAYQIVDKQKMITIQLYLSAKCKASGTPFFISGNVLERTLMSGSICGTDLDDVTNGVMQNAGFVLANYESPDLVTLALKYIDDMCKVVEPLGTNLDDFWRLIEQSNLPGTTSDACIVSCALLAKMCDAKLIIVTSVSGCTARWMSQISPDVIVIAITTRAKVARRLQIQRGIIPIVYERTPYSNWVEEMNARVRYAVDYGLKYDLLKYGNNYVAFTKAKATSAYNDSISFCTVCVLD